MSSTPNVLGDDWEDLYPQIEGWRSSVHPPGPEGAHQIVNRTDEPARYAVVDAKASPEIVEYPDSGKLAAMSFGESQRGGALWTVHRLDDVVDFFDGEEPKT
jgi:hypothetical protein